MLKNRYENRFSLVLSGSNKENLDYVNVSPVSMSDDVLSSLQAEPQPLDRSTLAVHEQDSQHK